MNQMNKEKTEMRRMSVLKSRPWRDGDGLCEQFTGLVRYIGNRGLSPVVDSNVAAVWQDYTGKRVWAISGSVWRKTA